MDSAMLKEYLPFLIPLVIAQYALAITALVHVLRHPRYRFGNKVMWVLIVLFIQLSVRPYTLLSVEVRNRWVSWKSDSFIRAWAP